MKSDTAPTLGDARCQTRRLCAMIVWKELDNCNMYGMCSMYGMWYLTMQDISIVRARCRQYSSTVSVSSDEDRR